MENSVTSYKSIDEAWTNYDTKGYVKISIATTKDDPKFVSLGFSGDIVDYFYGYLRNNRKNEIRQNLCYLAIKNLIKKNNFLQLSLQLAENQITDDEFEEELRLNTPTYLIEMKSALHIHELNIISEILTSINKELTIDEVCELFSIDPEATKEHIALHK